MVDDTGDIPDRDDLQPKDTDVFEDVLESGELIVTLEDGSTYELHTHDTYIYDDMIYTKDSDDDVWFFKDSVVAVTRHYD